MQNLYAALACQLRTQSLCPAQAERKNSKSGKKLRPQKGTGRSRQGSANAMGAHGGTCFGRKAKRPAMRHAAPKRALRNAWQELCAQPGFCAACLPASACPDKTALAAAWLETAFPGGGPVAVLCKRLPKALRNLPRVRAAGGQSRTPALLQAAACGALLILS